MIKSGLIEEVSFWEWEQKESAIEKKDAKNRIKRARSKRCVEITKKPLKYQNRDRGSWVGENKKMCVIMIEKKCYRYHEKCAPI